MRQRETPGSTEVSEIHRRWGNGIMSLVVSLQCWIRTQVSVVVIMAVSQYRRRCLRRRRRTVGRVGSSTRRLVSQGRHNTFSSFNDGLFHRGGSVATMQFIVESTSITNWMSIFVPSPKWSHSGPTVLTGDQHVSSFDRCAILSRIVFGFSERSVGP